MKAKIISVDTFNETGMVHLDAEWSDEDIENNCEFKKAHLNEIIEVGKAHFFGKTQVYYSTSLKEYFSEYELEILD